MRRALVPVVLLFVLASLAAACGGSDDDVDVTGGSAASSPDDATGTDDTTASTSSPGGGSVVIWPPTDSPASDDAAAVAVEFATEFLGIAEAQTTDEDTDAGCAADVPVTKGPEGATTTVHLAQGDEGCVVIGATSEEIVVDAPGDGADITSPIVVHGQANAFEGTVVVEVRPAGSTEAIGEGFVTGASGELAPFEGAIDFASGTEAGGSGAVVFYAPDESGEGTAISATAVGVRFA